MTNDISNTSNRIITFSVIRHPKLGRLVMRQSDNSTVDISTFTQDMVSEQLEVISTLSFQLNKSNGSPFKIKYEGSSIHE